MRITEITVSASRTFNHPYEEYSNLKPGVVLKASIDEFEDYEAAVKALQAKAEGMIEDHKQSLLKSIHDLAQVTEMQREMRSLESQMRSAQERLEEIRARNPELLPTAQIGAGNGQG